MTVHHGFSAKIASGDGVLGRFGSTLVLAPEDSAIVDAVLDLAREANASHSEAPGQFLPRRVAGLVAQSDDAPTLAIVAAREDGLAVLLVGDVTLTLVDETGTTTVSGLDATTWVDRIVRGTWTSLTLALAGAGAINARSDFPGGVVTGGGVVLMPAGPAAPVLDPKPVLEPVEPDLVEEEPAAFASLSLTDSEGLDTEALPALAAPSAPEPVSGAASASGAVVQGIECSQQHFNDPTSTSCAVCGAPMLRQSLVSGPRPPLGVLVLDDGSAFSLDGDYVLGREPDNAPEVLSGTATGLALTDPDATMSRVHVKLLLVGWDVELHDANSANGTYAAKPGDTEWTRLAAGASVVLEPGAKVALGSRTFFFAGRDAP